MTNVAIQSDFFPHLDLAGGWPEDQQMDTMSPNSMRFQETGPIGGKVLKLLKAAHFNKPYCSAALAMHRSASYCHLLDRTGSMDRLIGRKRERDGLK